MVEKKSKAKIEFNNINDVCLQMLAYEDTDNINRDSLIMDKIDEIKGDT